MCGHLHRLDAPRKRRGGRRSKKKAPIIASDVSSLAPIKMQNANVKPKISDVGLYSNNSMNVASPHALNSNHPIGNDMSRVCDTANRSKAMYNLKPFRQLDGKAPISSCTPINKPCHMQASPPSNQISRSKGHTSANSIDKQQAKRVQQLSDSLVEHRGLDGQINQTSSEQVKEVSTHSINNKQNVIQAPPKDHLLSSQSLHTEDDKQVDNMSSDSSSLPDDNVEGSLGNTTAVVEETVWAELSHEINTDLTNAKNDVGPNDDVTKYSHDVIQTSDNVIEDDVTQQESPLCSQTTLLTCNETSTDNVTPFNDDDATPDNYDVTLGDYDVTSGDYDATPGDCDAMPGRYDATSNDYDSTPGNYDITPDDIISNDIVNTSNCDDNFSMLSDIDRDIPDDLVDDSDDDQRVDHTLMVDDDQNEECSEGEIMSEEEDGGEIPKASGECEQEDTVFEKSLCEKDDRNHNGNIKNLQIKHHHGCQDDKHGKHHQGSQDDKHHQDIDRRRLYKHQDGCHSCDQGNHHSSRHSSQYSGHDHNRRHSSHQDARKEKKSDVCQQVAPRRCSTSTSRARGHSESNMTPSRRSSYKSHHHHSRRDCDRSHDHQISHRSHEHSGSHDHRGSHDYNRSSYMTHKRHHSSSQAEVSKYVPMKRRK